MERTDTGVDPQIDWSARADGRPHTLIKGTHYTRDARKVRRAASAWAARNCLRAVTRISADGGELTVTFVARRGKV